jgi:hypothetical protein
MVKQKGNIYVYMAVGVTVLGMVTALGFGAVRYVNGVDAKAYERGRKEVEATYAQRDNEALRAAQDEIARLTGIARAKEAALAKATTEVDIRRQREIDNARTQRERDIASVRAGFRLLDPGCARSPASPDAGSGRSGSALAGGTSLGDGPSGCRLSGEATEFLLGEAERADEVAEQLKAAQDLIGEYHRTINAP